MSQRGSTREERLPLLQCPGARDQGSSEDGVELTGDFGLAPSRSQGSLGTMPGEGAASAVRPEVLTGWRGSATAATGYGASVLSCDIVGPQISLDCVWPTVTMVSISFSAFWRYCRLEILSRRSAFWSARREQLTHSDGEVSGAMECTVVAEDQK